MTLIPYRFWGHPDDWTDETFDEYMRLTHSRKLRHRFLCFVWNLR